MYETLVVWVYVYGYWLCEGNVWISVVMRLVYGYWLCEDKCMDIGCVETIVRILVV